MQQVADQATCLWAMCGAAQMEVRPGGCAWRECSLLEVARSVRILVVFLVLSYFRCLDFAHYSCYTDNSQKAHYFKYCKERLLPPIASQEQTGFPRPGFPRISQLNFPPGPVMRRSLVPTTPPCILLSLNPTCCFGQCSGITLALLSLCRLPFVIAIRVAMSVAFAAVVAAAVSVPHLSLIGLLLLK